jgi:sterol desaturase/sphingolipid hydroxylase (fatty acid hydroxylase superfamily)
MALGIWANQRYFLNKMSLRELVFAYLTHQAIVTYLAGAAICGTLAAILTDSWVRTLLAAGLVIPIYPVVWYLLHRFVLHGRMLYKSPRTAVIWKRIHFDHHQDPNDLSVLFGALYTTLPTIAIIALPLGWAAGGPAGALAALAMGLAVTCFYEFCHCIQHLPFAPRWQWLRDIKKLHLAHHFHNEAGNYGITNFLVDRALGTFYGSPKGTSRSATVFNLGYTEAEARRYPWVARLSGVTPEDLNHRRPTRTAAEA